MVDLVKNNAIFAKKMCDSLPNVVKNMRFGKVSRITYSGFAASYRRSAPSYSLKEASHRAPPVL